MPDLTDISQTLLQVALNKADVTITEPSSADPYLSANPGKLKRVAGPALQVQEAGLDVAVGEEELKSLLNTSIKGLHTIGYIERLLNRYTNSPAEFYYPARPWGEASKPLQGAK